MWIVTNTLLGERLATTIRGLGVIIGRFAYGAGALEKLLVLAHVRLGRIARRFDRLATRWLAGTLPTRRPRSIKPRATKPIYGPPRPPALRAPSGDSWLVRLAQPTKQHAGSVEYLLADPQTRALVEAAPQAGRLLRPLCRMLGVELPDYLRLPPRPKPVRPKPAKPPAPPEPPRTGTPDRPIPAYVLAAARAWRTRPA